MTNFKGTKGKWLKNLDYFNQIQSEDGINICDCWGDMGKRFPNTLQMEANVILISKAPEMLEMLERISNINPNHSIAISDCQDEIEKLIKEATTL